MSDRRQVRVTMVLSFDPKWPTTKESIRKMVENNEAFDPQHDRIDSIEVEPERRDPVGLLEFEECSICAAKIGSPLLCDDCLRRRSLTGSGFCSSNELQKPEPARSLRSSAVGFMTLTRVRARRSE